jgi:hypothetical protein
MTQHAARVFIRDSTHKVLKETRQSTKENRNKEMKNKRRKNTVQHPLKILA